MSHRATNGLVLPSPKRRHSECFTLTCRWLAKECEHLKYDSMISDFEHLWTLLLYYATATLCCRIFSIRSFRPLSTAAQHCGTSPMDRGLKAGIAMAKQPNWSEGHVFLRSVGANSCIIWSQYVTIIVKYGQDLWDFLPHRVRNAATDMWPKKQSIVWFLQHARGEFIALFDIAEHYVRMYCTTTSHPSLVLVASCNTCIKYHQIQSIKRQDLIHPSYYV